MNRLARYAAIGALALAAPLVLYCATPIFLAVVSLGEICPYSPFGTSLCARSAPAVSGLQPVARASPTLRALGRLAFAASTENGSPLDLYTINADGTGLRNVTKSVEADDRSPSWAPDGLSIAFNGGQGDARDIHVIDVASGSARNLTKGDGINYDPAWSPDGRQIVFASERTDDQTGEYDDNFELYARRQDGEVAKLTRNDADDVDPVWSPDGAVIAFSSKRDGNWEIYAMNADGSGQRNLTNDPADDEEPAWSPDGGKIVFVSDRDDRAELYVMNSDGSAAHGLTKATTIPTGKSSPAWSPDGRRLAFLNPPDQGIYVVKADGSDGRKVITGVDPAGGLAWQPAAG